MPPLTPTEPRRALLWPDLVDELAERAPDPSTLYMVGGMVRDALTGRPGHDVDLATPSDGLAAARELADAFDGAYYPVDAERRTGRVILGAEHGGTVVDVASFRGDSLLDDLRGRDFTVNAMAVRLDQPQQIYDPLGGQRDLFDERILRQCSPDSIASDPIRTLRAVRQSLQLRLRIAPETTAVIRAAAPHLSDEEGSLEQPERARDELFRMLNGPQPAAALRALSALGLLDALCPFPVPDIDALNERLDLVKQCNQIFTLISPQRTDNTASQLRLGVAVMILDRYRRQLQEHLSREFVEGRPVRALALLGALTPATVVRPGDAWAGHLHLATSEARFLNTLAETRALVPGDPPVDSRAAHRYYRATGEAGVTGVLLMLGEALARSIAPEQWGVLLEHVAAPLLEAFFRRHQEVVTPPPLLDGRDLMQALDLEPGPHIGRVLAQLLEEQAAGAIRTREEALRLAERLSDESH